MVEGGWGSMWSLLFRKQRQADGQHSDVTGGPTTCCCRHPEVTDARSTPVPSAHWPTKLLLCERVFFCVFRLQAGYCWAAAAHPRPVKVILHLHTLWTMTLDIRERSEPTKRTKLGQQVWISGAVGPNGSKAEILKGLDLIPFLTFFLLTAMPLFDYWVLICEHQHFPAGQKDFYPLKLTLWRKGL